ncbi:hypothetical protein CHS0354_014307 [Potamilus streckersoni]|uniref:Death domain-containing protein n=1 Tax=Potamilus streckersoni TaxID=2493646 RepID=A0AAE0SKV5_9BIVA|nr:hypothetical protein CHS0354_014307 [Potamilus streckersoni]
MAITKERANQLFSFINTDASEKATALLEEEVDFSITNHGYNLIHLASRKGMKDVVEKLIRKGMSVNSSNENGNTAMHYAAREGHIEVVELLIKNGADANITNKDGNTAMQTAVKSQAMNVIDRLKALGLSVNHRNRKGETALHIAVMNNKQEAVEALLMNGANAAVKDNEGREPETYANDPDLADLIRMYSVWTKANQSGYILAEEIQISPKLVKIPLLMSRVGVAICKLDTKVDLPFLLYCRREKTEHSSIKLPLEKGDEIVSDIFRISVRNNFYNVKLQVKIPLYDKISHKEKLIIKFLDGATKQCEQTDEQGDNAYCPLELDMNPGSSVVLVVLSRAREEEFTVGTEGISIHSKIDEDFIIDIPPGAFEDDTKISMKVYETHESEHLVNEGTNISGRNTDKCGSANAVLLTDIFQVSIDGKQPKLNVKLQIPSHGVNDKNDDIVIVAADENNLVDENSIEIIPTKPKCQNGKIIFEVKHFSIHVAVSYSSMKSTAGCNDVFDRIAESRNRKRPCVFFCVIQRIDNNQHLAVVECTTTENGKKRRKFWGNKGYEEQNMAQSGTFMMEPSQEFQVSFSGNIKVFDDTGQRRLNFLPKRTSYQPYRIGLKEYGKTAVGVVNVLRIQRGEEDGKNPHEHVTSLPVELQIIVTPPKTIPEPNFMILKPESLGVLGMALTKTKGKQLGIQLGLDPKTISRIWLDNSSIGDANYKILEKWINIITDGRNNLSIITESTLINALKAIGMQSFADVLICVRDEGRILRKEDFND